MMQGATRAAIAMASSIIAAAFTTSIVANGSRSAGTRVTAGTGHPLASLGGGLRRRRLDRCLRWGRDRVTAAGDQALGLLVSDAHAHPARCDQDHQTFATCLLYTSP